MRASQPAAEILSDPERGQGVEREVEGPFLKRCGTLVEPMNPSQPKIQLTQTEEYREIYSNSVQVRVSVWDFLLVFGLVHQESPEQVNVNNTLGVYLSPQQAKALWNVLGQNLAQYEQTFGALALEPQPPKGPVH